MLVGIIILLIAIILGLLIVLFKKKSSIKDEYYYINISEDAPFWLTAYSKIRIKCRTKIIHHADWDEKIHKVTVSLIR